MNQLRRRVDMLVLRIGSQRSPLPPRPPLRTPEDVVVLLGEQVETVRQAPDVDPLERARTLSVIGALALRAMDAAQGAARVEALERALKLRAEQQRQQEKQKRQQQSRR